MRGLGLPGCGRGVTVPIPRKPKPMAASASMYSPFLSRPAARPSALGNSRPMSLTLRAGPASARTEAMPVRSISLSEARAKSCATSGSIPNRKRRAREYSMARFYSAARVTGVLRGEGFRDSAEFFLREAAPLTVDQPLDRPESGLVGHFAAVPDPVAKIQVGQREAAALLDLPQNIVSAEAGGGDAGLEEGIDRRHAVAEDVDDRHHHQLASVAELDQTRVDPALQQEVGILVTAVLVHAAAGMAMGLVAQVERIVLVSKTQALRRKVERGVPLVRAALRARGLELRHRNAHRHAGAAGVAIVAVGEDAAAAKTDLHQRAIDFTGDQMAGRGNLRARQLSRQVAAGIRRGHVELQYRVRQVVKQRHRCPSPGRPTSLASRHSLPIPATLVKIYCAGLRARRGWLGAGYASGNRSCRSPGG